MFDTSQLVPEARLIVEAVATSYMRHTKPWFICLLVHGSALKGGFIPGCSDIDLQLFLDEQIFGDHQELPFETCLAIQRDLAKIDPAPFRYIQGKASSTVLPAGQMGPVPGAYLLLAGKLPIAEASKVQLWESARARIAGLNPLPTYLPGSLLEHGTGRLAWHIRWICTDVWPTVYQVLILQGHDPFSVWGLSKPHALVLLPPETVLSQTIRAFHRAVRSYYPAERSTEEGLAVIKTGVAFLRAVKSWWQVYSWQALDFPHFDLS